MDTAFVGVTQDGHRQMVGHITQRRTAGMYMGLCGYGWYGNVDLYDLAKVREAKEHARGGGDASRERPRG